jgi:hypothetical protein
MVLLVTGKKYCEVMIKKSMDMDKKFKSLMYLKPPESSDYIGLL